MSGWVQQIHQTLLRVETEKVWAGLRNYCTKVNRKKIKDGPNASVCWPHYDRMEFLLPHIENRSDQVFGEHKLALHNPSGSTSPCESAIENSSAADYNDHTRFLYQDLLLNGSVDSIPIDSEEPVLKKPRPATSNSISKIMPQVQFDKGGCSAEENFGSFVAKRLTAMEEEKRGVVEFKIHEIILRAERDPEFVNNFSFQ